MELNADILLLTDHFEKAREAVRQFLLRQTSASVSELRQIIGASRRVVVPLLEKLDRDGVTRRNGDKRSLKALTGPENPHTTSTQVVRS